MTDPNVPAAKPARDLRPGDRIAARFLPSGMAGTVLRVPDAFLLPSTGEPWVMVTYRLTDTAADAEHFHADRLIPLEAVADNGMGYSREADDPTPISPARVPLHTGGVVDGGQLVDETARDGVFVVADGHLQHECCGRIDDDPHFSSCAQYTAPVSGAR